MLTTGFQFIAPGVAAPVESAPGGVFPLRLGWQAGVAVASVNLAKSALVTATGEIEKGERVTRCGGPSPSAGHPSPGCEPIEKRPPARPINDALVSLCASVFGTGAALAIIFSVDACGDG